MFLHGEHLQNLKKEKIENCPHICGVKIVIQREGRDMALSIDLEQQYDKIYRYCYFKLHSRTLAEDVTQETFLRFLESKTYQNKGQALRYLYVIARNLCIQHHRTRPLESLPQTLADYDAPQRMMTSLTLQSALQALSEQERELVLLRYVNDVPVSVLCKLFGLSRFAVYRKTKGAIRILQDQLKEEDFDETGTQTGAANGL